MIDGLILIGGGVAAGVFGSLLGLGGGILMVPLLTLVFDLPLLTAVGVSLVCVIVTSGASAGVYLERRVANLRLGMVLELFTAIGALGGALVAFILPENLLEGLFAILLVYVAATMARRRDPAPGDAAPPALEAGIASDTPSHAVSDTPSDAASEPHSGGSFVDSLSGPGYRVRHLGFGAVGSVFAGVSSALLGIGGGLVKVPVMHVLMGVPLRVATATSNLMIGITAPASAIIYLLRGGIDVYVASPTAVGVFLGASLGSRIAHRIPLGVLRGVFVVILLYTSWQMLQRALA